MKATKKILSVLLALVLALGLAACSSAETPAASADPAETSDTEESPAESAGAESPAASGEAMTFTWWGSDTRHEATEQAVNLYTEQTGVQIDIEYSAWDGYWERMAVLAASNAMPDVFQMDAAYINTYIENGQLADLTDMLDLSPIMDESEIENYKVDGKLYGAPVGANGTGFVYSKTMLEEYGIPEPTEGWTWDEMLAWARDAATKLPDGVYPITDGYSYESMQNYVETNYGIKLLDGDAFNLTEELYLEYFNLYADLREEGVVPKAEESLSFVELDPLSDSFTSRKVLLRQINVGNVASLADMMPDDELGVVNFPRGEFGGGWCQSTMFYCVGANSAHQQEACDLRARPARQRRGL